jgi:hypothetical protein
MKFNRAATIAVVFAIIVVGVLMAAAAYGSGGISI